MHEAVLALGSNIGNRNENIRNATRAIDLLPGTTVLAVSGSYESIPMETDIEQDNYINSCVKIITELTPRALLGALLGIEAAMGRVRTVKNGPRVIDLDLLLYEDVKSNDAELTLPHPRILSRAFVLVPLSDLFPDCKAFGLDFCDALKKIDKKGVSEYFD